ncbi:MAG: PepSY domain-containing protein [Gammaproteobacteria bacterium]|nr:PepSY domain-containing protein [Gammaproteobacteria bacterium]
MVQTIRTPAEINKRALSRKFYQLIIRWHFFCGLLFIPLIIVISISGCIYLFEDEYEEFAYQDMLFVNPGATKLSASALISLAAQSVPGMKVSHFKMSDDPARSSEVIFKAKHQHKPAKVSMEWAGDGPEKVPMVMNRARISVYINPYTGAILGSIKSTDRFMNIMKDLHGNLLGGKFGTKFVELTSCWVMMLMVTGLIMWWPRWNTGIMGTLIPRLNQNKRLFWRDLHAVPAFYFSLLIIFMIISGLPWTDVWGEAFHTIQRELKMSSPAGFHSRSLKSRYVADGHKISVDTVIAEARNRGYQGNLDVKFPRNKVDTFAIQVDSDDPATRPSMHLDQYTGNVIAASDWSNVPLLAKSVTYGIKLHRGEYFGVWNLVLVLITTLVLIFLAVSGVVMWLQRRPKGKLGSPKYPRDYRVPNWVIGTTLGFSVFMPLLGASLIVFSIGDWMYHKTRPVPA